MLEYCLGNKLTHFKRIGHVKNMLKGNQCALPRRVCGTQQHTWNTYIVYPTIGADKSLELQLF